MERSTDCVICMGPLTVRNLSKLACGHVYHDTCLLQWLGHSVSCPLCRRGLAPEAPPPRATWNQVGSLALAVAIFSSGWALKPILGPSYLVMAHILSALMILTESALGALLCVWISMMFSSPAEIEAISNRSVNMVITALFIAVLGYWACALVGQGVRNAYRMATRHPN